MPRQSSSSLRVVTPDDLRALTRTALEVRRTDAAQRGDLAEVRRIVGEINARINDPSLEPESEDFEDDEGLVEDDGDGGDPDDLGRKPYTELAGRRAHAERKGNLAEVRRIANEGERREYEPEREPKMGDGTFWAPDRVFEMGLTPAQIAVYLFMCRRAKRSGVAFPGRQDIARACGIRPDTVSAALKTLDGLTMLDRHRRFDDSTLYQILPVSGWGPRQPRAVRAANTVSRKEARTVRTAARGRSPQLAPLSGPVSASFVSSKPERGAPKEVPEGSSLRNSPDRRDGSKRKNSRKRAHESVRANGSDRTTARPLARAPQRQASATRLLRPRHNKDSARQRGSRRPKRRATGRAS